MDDRYEIPVPLKPEVVERLPNNYHSALNRTLLIQKRALKNVKLREILLNTFQELLDENWLVPVYDSISEQDKCWYLPFFVSRQDKPRVVFDGAATFKGVSLNDGVLPGVNLLNGLVEVLTRFRLGKYACMADLSKCFFQISMPREQQDLFRLMWYDKNDIDNGHLQVFRFCRHVWGINSTPYVPCSQSIIQVNRISVAGVVFDNLGIKFGLDRLIEVSADLYTLEKRLTYLIAFKQYVIAKVKHKEFCRPPLTADVFEKSFVDVIWYVQNSCFGVVIELLKQRSSDAFVSILKKLTDNALNSDDLRRISELKSLRDLRPCVDDRQMLRVDGRLENSELPLDSKHPLILPGSHALTRLIVLNEHVLAGHAGPSYVLMKTRQRFWIIRGISSVKRYLSDCSKCVRRRATPIRQLMADLPVCRVTATNKPFKFSGCDFLGPLKFRQGRSECKAWGLLFTCLCTRCIHVEIVTSLDLNSFLLAFSRFTNLRGNVDTMYSDNGSTFRAAADRLPSLLRSNVFLNSLRKKGINWVFIPPYSPSQGGSWEIMVKLFKKALYAVLDEVRRMPTLIELQTFTSDAVRIVNDRPLTSLSSEPNDLAALSPSSFLGQQLAPYTPLSSFHDEDDLRRDFRYNMTLANKFWLSWFKGYLPTLQGRGKWRNVKENIAPGQLVLVGDAPDIGNRGTYRIGRIHKVHPQLRNGKEIVRRATVAVLKHSGSGEIEYILRDLSKIAPL